MNPTYFIVLLSFSLCYHCYLDKWETKLNEWGCLNLNLSHRFPAERRCPCRPSLSDTCSPIGHYRCTWRSSCPTRKGTKGGIRAGSKTPSTNWISIRILQTCSRRMWRYETSSQRIGWSRYASLFERVVSWLVTHIGTLRCSWTESFYCISSFFHANYQSRRWAPLTTSTSKL